jgi:signal transduction histidine kinase
VEVRSRVEGGRISVEVADSGPGVPLALRDRVFEPFFTTKDPGKGTGLGLSISRSIVARHGGTLDIRDVAGRSSFVIELPNKLLVSSTKAI